MIPVIQLEGIWLLFDGKVQGGDVSMVVIKSDGTVLGKQWAVLCLEA